MEKNVGSVDLAELMKAREELNRDMGISTDPDMYKNYNPNRQQEQTDNSSEEDLANNVDYKNQQNTDLQDFSAEEISEPEVVNDQDDEIAIKTSGEKDFSVYDSFADFEIEENASKTLAENTNSSENIVAENMSENNDLQDTLSSLNEFLVSNSEENKPEQKQSETIVNDSEKIVPPMPSNSNINSSETSLQELEELLGFSDFSLNNSNDSEQIIENSQEEITDKLEVENKDNAISSESIQENNNITQENSKNDNLSMLQDLLNLDSVQQVEPVKEEESQQIAYKSEDSKLEAEKYNSEFNASEQDSEEKIKNALARLNFSKLKNPSEPELAEIENAYKTISGADFVDVIVSESFKNLDNFSYALGINEAGEYEFASLSGMYNVALFSKEEKSTNKFFNCLMLSLMLKNNYNDIKFYIADTQINSVFKKYNNSAYLGHNVSTNYNETLSILNSLISEIDERYETIAAAGLKNVEEYNKAMAESHIIGYPYSILIFNNYANLTNIEICNQIKDSLFYILKFGRLVGVYTYIKANGEISDDNINYNLATRIAFRANNAEQSVKMLGDEGAERLVGEDEFVFKTIYSEELKHIKTANITEREIELLIQNIEG